MPPSIQKALTQATVQLKPLAENPRLEAEILLTLTINKPRSFLKAWPEKKLSDQQNKYLSSLISKRKLGTPIAYLTGQKEFWSIPLTVNDHVLIPRSETELLIEVALSIIPPKATWQVADLGTGSGAIAISLAKERPELNITATDISHIALEVASKNVKKMDITSIELQLSHWFSNLGQKQFDIILSNPPYIRAGDPHLNQGDLRFEPLSALISGPDGLQDLSQIGHDARQHLAQGGFLIMEHGYDQADSLGQLLQELGYQNLHHHHDLAGNIRAISAQWFNG
ncbi:MAG: peptide chain release factor N(5)-glutamine methyltransferase [Methylococcaceae bacterium]